MSINDLEGSSKHHINSIYIGCNDSYELERCCVNQWGQTQNIKKPRQAGNNKTAAKWMGIRQ